MEREVGAFDMRDDSSKHGHFGNPTIEGAESRVGTSTTEFT